MTEKKPPQTVMQEPPVATIPEAVFQCQGLLSDAISILARVGTATGSVLAQLNEQEKRLKELEAKLPKPKSPSKRK